MRCGLDFSNVGGSSIDHWVDYRAHRQISIAVRGTKVGRAVENPNIGDEGSGEGLGVLSGGGKEDNQT